MTNASDLSKKNLLGINGLGRIGKLTLWYHLQARHFEGFVVNVGRTVGKDLLALIHSIERDSTYGPMDRFLYGCSGNSCDAKIIDEEAGILEINGLPVKILRSNRNPRDINWTKEGVKLVVDCTGKYRDPVAPAEKDGGSVRGHLQSGAAKVIISAPFKIKDPAAILPDDTETLIFGINHRQFDPRKHNIISAASCTTTGLAHMMKPLIEDKETSHIITASMSTVHAATGTQDILDALPKTGAGDLRKNRSVLNNIIITSTGAAQTLEKVMPEINRIGFMADSVRIPTNTVSLITLNITFHTVLGKNGEPVVTQDFINYLYQKAADGPQKGMLIFSQRQNVSSDIMGYEAGVVIEGHETHTRTGFMSLPADLLSTYGLDPSLEIQVPMTHAKIFGWYDNEYGSYVTSLGKLTVYIDKMMG